MAQIKLIDCVTFIPGINQYRADKQFSSLNIIYYDQSSFEQDFNFKYDSANAKMCEEKNNQLELCEGDIVISNVKQLASMVGRNNAGKTLPLNFTKVEFKNDLITKQYFLYMFNAYPDVKRQKEREMQGIAAIQKITLRSLGQLCIPYVSLSEQEQIGRIYSEMLQLQSKLKKYADLSERFVCDILESSLKDEGGKVDER